MYQCAKRLLPACLLSVTEDQHKELAGLSQVREILKFTKNFKARELFGG